MRIALVTSQVFPQPHWHDTDAPRLAEQLRRRGAEVTHPAWDGPEQLDRAGFDVLVLQSPWSMWRSVERFRGWVRARAGEGALLLNPAGVLLLGSDKRYLTALAAAGVPVVPTTVFESPPSSRLRPVQVGSGSVPRRLIIAAPSHRGSTLAACCAATGVW